MEPIELYPFIPATASYKIWHPKDFIASESEDNIVTLDSLNLNSTLTVSGYHVNVTVTEEMLSDFFREITNSYTPLSEIKCVITGDRIWLEGDFRKEEVYWVWWALALSNQIVLASINSKEKLSDAERHLYTFMIDKMEIYPAEFDEE